MSLVQSINGSYQFVEETQGANYPNLGFLEPIPEPCVTAQCDELKLIMLNVAAGQIATHAMVKNPATKHPRSTTIMGDIEHVNAKKPRRRKNKENEVEVDEANEILAKGCTMTKPYFSSGCSVWIPLFLMPTRQTQIESSTKFVLNSIIF